MKLMGSPDGVTGPINIGNPNEITVRQLAERVNALIGDAREIIFEPLPSDDPTRRCPDITKAREILGWEPKTDLDTGLAATIEYFKNHPDRVNW